MLKEFRDFIMRGNVLDLAVAVVIGAAFSQIVTSLVNDIIMPPIGLLLGRVNFSHLFIDLSGGNYTSLEAAKAAGAATLNYGAFINTVINFLIIALAIFLVTRQVNRFKPKAEAAPVTTKECSYCLTVVPLRATRCPACTSDLTATPVI